MKKVVNIISIIFILLLFYLTKNSDILLLTISFSMYILLSSIFSTISIKEDNYKLFKICLLSILIIGVPLMIISYLVGDILNIDKLNIINIFIVVSLICNIILKLTCDYLEVINYKKLSYNILNIYKIITLTIKIILVILLFGIFKINSYISIILLYLVDFLVFIIIGIMVYLLVFKNYKKRDKVKINYIKEIKNILITNKVNTIYNIVNSGYIYTSIIILYYVLSNKYNYIDSDVSLYITNTYFYGLILIYIIYKIIKKYLNINIKDNFNDNVNKIIKVLLMLTILFTIISKPISYIIFGSNYNILINLIPLLFTFIFYDFIITTNMDNNKERNVIISLIIGIIVKLVFEIPLINSVYRMGYSLVFGSVLSIVLGLIISSIVGIMLIKNKLKLSLLDNFNNLLNIIYENIIYTLILVLFTFVVKIDTNGFIISILVIIFYLFITILFIFIKRKLKCK